MEVREPTTPASPAPPPAESVPHGAVPVALTPFPLLCVAVLLFGLRPVISLSAAEVPSGTQGPPLRPLERGSEHPDVLIQEVPGSVAFMAGGPLAVGSGQWAACGLL